MDRGTENYRRFLAGEEAGLVEVIRENKDGLILYLHSIVHDLDAAEQLTEDTFVRLAVRKPRDRGTAGFRTWLYTIGRNLALDYLRRKRTGAALSLEDLPEQKAQQEALETAYLRQEQRLQVRRAMDRLPPDYRQVLWLLYFEDFSCRQAARILKRSAHAVETLTWRARLALKQELEQEGYVYDDLP